MKKTERRWMWKRALSMLLVCAMLFTSTDLTVLAVEPGMDEMTISGAGTETVSGDEMETMLVGEDDGAHVEAGDNAAPSVGVEQEMFSFEAKDNIGSLFVDDMQEAVQNEQEAIVEEYAISDIQVSGVTATVTFHAIEDCTVVISVYEEGSQKPYAFGSAPAASAGGKVEVTIETGQMPEYFEMKAYLVEADSLRPLSKEFHSRQYTQEIQFVENLTVNDFDPEMVVNLDEDETTNFLVFREGTILVRENVDTNVLTDYDKTTNTYSFKNADETIKGLKEGDIFVYYDVEDRLRVIRVQGVYTDNTSEQSSFNDITESEEQTADEEGAEPQNPDEEDTEEQTSDEEGTEAQDPDEEDMGEQTPDEGNTEAQNPGGEDTGEETPAEEDMEVQEPNEEDIEPQNPDSDVLSGQMPSKADSGNRNTAGESKWRLTVDEKISDMQDIGNGETENQEDTDSDNQVVGDEETDGPGNSGQEINEQESDEQEADGQNVQESTVKIKKAQTTGEENSEDYSEIITKVEAANIENSEYLGEKIKDESDYIDKFCKVRKIEVKINNASIPQVLLGGGQSDFKAEGVDVNVSVLHKGRDKQDGEDYEYDTWSLSLGAGMDNVGFSIDADVSFAFETDIKYYYYDPIWWANLPFRKEEIHYTTCSLMLDTRLSGKVSAKMDVAIPLTEKLEVDAKFLKFKCYPELVIGGEATLTVKGFRVKRNYMIVAGTAAPPVVPGLYQGETKIEGPSDLALEATFYIGVVFKPNAKLGIKLADDQNNEGEENKGEENKGEENKGEENKGEENKGEENKEGESKGKSAETESDNDENEAFLTMFELGMSIGAKINLNVSRDFTGNSHSACQGKCESINLELETPFSLTLTLFGHDIIENVLKKWFPNLNEPIPSTPLFEAYNCQVHGGFKRGKCPYIGSKTQGIKVEVHDRTKNNFVEGATVISSLGASREKTDSKGRTNLEINKGSQNIYIEKDGITYSQAVQIPEDVEDGVGVLNITIDPENPLVDSTAAKNVYIAYYNHNGERYVCYAAITQDGSLYMWGGNAEGQLGDGTREPQDKPIKVPLSEGVEKFQFSPDGLTCAAITKKKELYLWGYNGSGIVGVDNEIDFYNIPFQVLQNEKVEKFIFSPNNNNSAAITVDGKLYMWGRNDYHQVDDSAVSIIRAPKCVMNNVAELVMENDTCAAVTTEKKGSKLYLWGNNVDGIAGQDPDEELKVLPSNAYSEISLAYVEQMSIQSDFRGKTTGSALLKDGSLIMWGSGYSEEITVQEEDGKVNSYWIPYKQIMGFENKIKKSYMDVSTNRAAAITADGSLYMWNDISDTAGDLKDHATIITTYKVKGLKDVEEFYMNSGSYAAITKNHQLYMWGRNSGYQLGNGTTNNVMEPTMVLEGKEVLSFEMLYDGNMSVALVKNEDTKDLYIWGSYTGRGTSSGGSFDPMTYDAKPQLKLSDVERFIPYPDTPASGAGTISSSEANFAAIKSDGSLYEWMGSKEAKLRTGIKEAADVNSVVRNARTSAQPVYWHYRIGRGQDGNLYTWDNNSSAAKKEYLFGSKYIFIDPASAASEYSLTDITEEMSVQSFGTEEALISTYAEATSQQTADFTSLLPNELYNIYAMKSREAEDCLASDNLLYIGQSTSDGDGNLNVTFEMKEAYAAPAIFCVGFKRTDLAGAEITISDIVYDGNRHIPEVTVTYNGQVLKRGVDYKAYLDAYVEEVGEYELTIKGIGLYCGERKATFHVIEGNAPGEDDDPDNPSPDPVYGEVLKEDVPADGNIPEGLWIAGVSEAGYDYTGRAIKPEVRVYDHKKRLAEKTDYTIAYKNNTKAYGYTSDDQAFEAKKAPTITVTGKGNYTGKETQTFRILPLDISVKANAPDGTGTEADSVQTDDNVFAADNMTITANKKNQKPVPALMWNDKKLKNNTDYTITYYDSTGVKKLDYVKEAGNYYIELIGKGNFTGTRRVNLTVIGQSDQLKLMSKMTVAKIPNQSYTGSAIEPALTVKDGKTTLNKDEHYTVSYSRNTEIGTAYAVVTGIEEKGYSGTKRVSFKITGGSVSKATVTGLTGQTFVYGGVNKEPELTVSVKVAGVEKTLEKGTNYKVTWQKNRDAGTATAMITGVGGYTGTLKKTFKIQAFDIAANADGRFTAVLTQDEVPYAKGGTKPEVAVTFLRDNGTTQKLQEGKDYTLSYKNHTTLNDGSRADKLPTVTIKGKGNFKGTYGTKLTYKITTQDLGSLTLTAADKTYQNKKNIFATKVTITDLNGKVLKAGTDYEKVFTYAYKNETTLNDETVRAAGAAVDKNDIIPAGTVLEVRVSAKGSYTGTKTGEYRIAQASIASASVSIPKQTYTGQAITPDKDQITVKIKGKPVDASQYEIVPGSYKNNVKKGTASVTIRGAGNYGGTKTVKFTIRAKGFLWWWR